MRSTPAAAGTHSAPSAAPPTGLRLRLGCWRQWAAACETHASRQYASRAAGGLQLQERLHVACAAAGGGKHVPAVAGRHDSDSISSSSYGSGDGSSYGNGDGSSGGSSSNRSYAGGRKQARSQSLAVSSSGRDSGRGGGRGRGRGSSAGRAAGQSSRCTETAGSTDDAEGKGRSSRSAHSEEANRQVTRTRD
eukprot:363806-Chlamydomonas_euryale.AAC.1